MNIEHFISEAGLKRIEQAVADAENKSSGEIVPAVVSASSEYSWVGYRAAFLGWLAASLAVPVLQYWYPFAFDTFSARGMLAAQTGGLVIGWLLSKFHFGWRFLVPKAVIAEEVLEAAKIAFLRHGLMNTRDRTGVLIFISLRERRVQILGDQGINEKVGGEAFWKTEADLIVAAIRAGNPEQGIVQAIKEIGAKLEAHFPKRAGDTNELANKLRRD